LNCHESRQPPEFDGRCPLTLPSASVFAKLGLGFSRCGAVASLMTRFGNLDASEWSFTCGPRIDALSMESCIQPCMIFSSFNVSAKWKDTYTAWKNIECFVSHVRLNRNYEIDRVQVLSSHRNILILIPSIIHRTPRVEGERIRCFHSSYHLWAEYNTLKSDPYEFDWEH
jgi:hypothetical protein